MNENFIIGYYQGDQVITIGHSLHCTNKQAWTRVQWYKSQWPELYKNVNLLPFNLVSSMKILGG